MPIENADAEAAVLLARSLSQTIEQNGNDRTALVSKMADFLKSSGFAALPSKDGTWSSQGDEFLLAANWKAAGEEAPAGAVAFALSPLGKTASRISDAAALAATAMAIAKSGRPVAVMAAEEDAAGNAAAFRRILAAFPCLKSVRATFVPSPVRAFRMKDRLVLPLVSTFKGTGRLELTAQVTPSCDGYPSSRDAASHLTRGLQRILNQELPTRITDEARRMFQGLAQAGAPSLSLAMAGLGPTFCGMALESLEDSPLLPHLAQATRATASPVSVKIDASREDFLMPESATAVLDVRYLPGDDLKSVMLALREMLDDGALGIVPREGIPPIVAKSQSALQASLLKSLTAMAHTACVVPWMTGSVPDAAVLAPSDGEFIGLPVAGNPSGDELDATAWKKAVSALADGIIQAQDSDAAPAS